MLRTVDSLDGYTIQATDDEIGKVKEVYFDDQKWGVRYVIVETGSWLFSRKVLISPYSITRIDDTEKTIHVQLTREQVKNSPEIDTDQPVSRLMEHEYHSYYAYGNYWGGPYMWGNLASPRLDGSSTAEAALINEPSIQAADTAMGQPGDVHLRSSEAVIGYDIEGVDDSIGHVKDLIFDDKTWAVHYLLVDTRNWWPGGKKVLLATQWIDQISWPEDKVHIKLTQQQIKDSPEYDEDMPLDRNYETRLHQHYERQNYWDL